MHHNLCKNCEHTFEGKFCSNCGQKTATKRLDWNYVIDELKYTFLNLNGGLLYTCKQLLTRPGATTKEFIDGKRVKHYKPILLVFVLAGLTAFLSHYIDVEKIMQIGDSKNSIKTPLGNGKEIYEKVLSHYALIELALIPIISLCSYLAFKKWGYNYIENIVLNCFASAQRLLVSIALFPIEYFCTSSSYFAIIASVTTLFSYVLTIWIYYKIYQTKNIGDFILRFLLFLFLIFVVFLLTIIAGVVVFFLTKK